MPAGSIVDVGAICGLQITETAHLNGARPNGFYETVKTESVHANESTQARSKLSYCH